MRAGPDHDADHRDRGQQADHRPPVEQAADTDPPRPPFGAAAACAWLALRWRLVIVVLDRARGGGFFRFAFAVPDAVFQTEAQFGKRGAEPELWLLARTALFPPQRHPPTPAFPLDRD